MKGKDFTMPTSIGSLSNVAVMVVLIAMFAIVLVVARQALKEMTLFGDTGSWVVAFCAAVLSAIGLLHCYLFKSCFPAQIYQAGILLSCCRVTL